MLDIRVLLFDMGGVLVELRGIEVMLDWLGNRLTADELWHQWLMSEPVRQFETGRLGAEEFAARVTAEFGLKVEPRQFLQAFTGWPVGPYPGALAMLARIPSSYRRAVLSNSNALHWPRVRDDMGFGPAFDCHFVSHLTGRIKPDADAFEHVLDSLGCRAAQVLFLDDNLLNVEAAQGLGMKAFRVRGTAETERLLTDLGIIENPA